MLSRIPFLSKFQISVAHKRHVWNLECRKEAAAIFFMLGGSVQGMMYYWCSDMLSLFFCHEQHLGFTPPCALPDLPSVFSISGPDEYPAPHEVITFPTGYFITEIKGLNVMRDQRGFQSVLVWVLAHSHKFWCYPSLPSLHSRSLPHYLLWRVQSQQPMQKQWPHTDCVTSSYNFIRSKLSVTPYCLYLLVVSFSDWT